MFPTALRKEVIVLIAVKIAALALIYQLFFAPATRGELDGGAVAAHVLGEQSR